MNLEMLKIYAEAKVNICNLEHKLIKQNDEICKLKKQLKQLKNVNELNKYFNIGKNND